MPDTSAAGPYKDRSSRVTAAPQGVRVLSQRINGGSTMFREVTMYRIVCDHDGCEDSPSDGGDYAAWSDKDGATAEAEDSYWYVNGDKHYCDDHTPRCANEDCKVKLSRWDEVPHCEDCEPAVAPGGVVA